MSYLWTNSYITFPKTRAFDYVGPKHNRESCPMSGTILVLNGPNLTLSGAHKSGLMQP
jgi:hypothetical protein